MLEGVCLTLEVELGQGGRRGKCVCRRECCSEGSQVHLGSEGCHLLFLFFFLFPLFFRGPPLGAESGLIDTTKKAHEGK